MPEQKSGLEKQQNSIAKEADKGLKTELEQHQMLLELGKLIVSEMDMDTLFQVIVSQTRTFMGTEECSVFMFDKEKTSSGRGFPLTSRRMRSASLRTRGLPAGYFNIRNPF